MTQILSILTLVCPYGFFGENCAKKCNDTCTGCNTVNGSCEFGWRGYYCHESNDTSGNVVFVLSFNTLPFAKRVRC